MKSHISTLFLLCLTCAALAQEQMPEFVLQNGHSGAVNAVVFSPDGKTLASGSYDNTIKLWDVVSGRLVRTLEGHSSSVYTVAFAPDGKTLASGSRDNTVKLWDAASGQLLRTLEVHADTVSAVAFAPNGKTLASASSDKTIKLWAVASGQLLRTLEGHSSFVSAVMFSPDGKTLASGSWDKTVMLWETESGRLLKTLDDHPSFVSSVAFAPDGKTLASGSWGLLRDDNIIKLWNVNSGQSVRKFEGHSDAINTVVFSPDGKTLASGGGGFYGNYETIKVWDVASGLLLHELESYSYSINSVAFSPDGKTLASASSDRTVRLWNIASGALTHSLEGHCFYVDAVAFAPDGNTVASGSWNKTVKLWYARSGRLLRTFEGHSSFSTIAFTPDSKYLASGSENGNVKYWDVGVGKLLHTLHGHSSSVSAVAFSPDGKLLASGSEDETVKLWDISSGKLLRTLELYISAAALPFALSGTPVALSPTSNILAAGSWRDKTVRIWHITSGRLLLTLEGHSSYVNAVAFAPDGQTLASCSDDKTVKLWDTVSGKLLRTLKGHSHSVSSVAFAPDGQTLASGSGDNTVKLWDMAAGRLLRTFDGHSKSVLAVAFAPDGKSLISGSFDTSLRFWRVSDDRLLATVHAIDSTDYIIYTPQGYFAASEGAEQYAAWRIGNEVYSIEQYAEQFHRPDLIARALAGENLPPPQINIAVDLPPQLVWLNPISNTARQQVEIVLRYKGTSGLDEITCVHNNKPHDIPLQTGGKETEIRIPLQLTDYDNALVIRVHDENRLRSDWLRIDFQYEKGQKGPGSRVRETTDRQPQLGMYGKKYAIVIGVSDYEHLQKTAANENDLVDLQYAHKDAEAFIAYLQDSTLSDGGWEIRGFINEEATAREIRNILLRILINANRRDLIFIFFSGHARSHPLLEDDVYLLTHDFEPGVDYSGYPYSRLIDLISRTKAEHVIAFIDACRSGTIGFGGRGEDKKPRVDANAFGQRIEQIRENRVIFSSASGGQLSYEHKQIGHGVFTHFLLQGLQGAAPDEKFPEFVDLGELYKYVRENVLAYTQKHLKASQLPVLWEKRGAPDENFPIAIRRK